MVTDADILSKLGDPKGKEWAFQQILHRYQQKLYWHIRRMVVDHDDADDILQETFIKVWQHLGNFKGESKIYTWLFKIGSNEAINHLNKRKRLAQISIDDVLPELLDKFDASYLISGDEIQTKLQKVILTLPDKQRQVFHLKYYEDLSYDEISEITQTSVGALKASYHLAVKKIEERINLD